MLENSLVNLECKSIKHYNAGDHIIFIMKVINSKISETGRPMIYYNNKYK